MTNEEIMITAIRQEVADMRQELAAARLLADATRVLPSYAITLSYAVLEPAQWQRIADARDAYDKVRGKVGG